MGGGFRAGGAGGTRAARVRFAHGAVPALLSRTRALRSRPPLSRPERARVDQLVGRCAPARRQGTAPPRNVPAAPVFCVCGLSVWNGLEPVYHGSLTQAKARATTAPTVGACRRAGFCCVLLTR